MAKARDVNQSEVTDLEVFGVLSKLGLSKGDILFMCVTSGIMLLLIFSFLFLGMALFTEGSTSDAQSIVNSMITAGTAVAFNANASSNGATKLMELLQKAMEIVKKMHEHGEFSFDVHESFSGMLTRASVAVGRRAKQPYEQQKVDEVMNAPKEQKANEGANEPGVEFVECEKQQAGRFEIEDDELQKLLAEKLSPMSQESTVDGTGGSAKPAGKGGEDSRKMSKTIKLSQEEWNRFQKKWEEKAVDILAQEETQNGRKKRSADDCCILVVEQNKYFKPLHDSKQKNKKIKGVAFNNPKGSGSSVVFCHGRFTTDNNSRILRVTIHTNALDGRVLKKSMKPGQQVPSNKGTSFSKWHDF